MNTIEQTFQERLIEFMSFTAISFAHQMSSLDYDYDAGVEYLTKFCVVVFCQTCYDRSCV